MKWEEAIDAQFFKDFGEQVEHYQREFIQAEPRKAHPSWPGKIHPLLEQALDEGKDIVIFHPDGYEEHRGPSFARDITPKEP